MPQHVSSPVLTSPHQRGSFRVKDTFPGIAAFKSHTCQGHLFERRAVAEHTLLDGGQEVIDSMNAALERVCPSDPDAHGPTCPFDLLRFDAQVNSLLLRAVPRRSKPFLVR